MKVIKQLSIEDRFWWCVSEFSYSSVELWGLSIVRLECKSCHIAPDRKSKNLTVFRRSTVNMGHSSGKGSVLRIKTKQIHEFVCFFESACHENHLLFKCPQKFRAEVFCSYFLSFFIRFILKFCYKTYWILWSFVTKLIEFRNLAYICSYVKTMKKCRDPGSNWGPPDLQSDALPTELSRPCLYKCDVISNSFATSE